MFIKNAWYVAAWADELRGAPLGRRICNEPVVLFRDATGRASALADYCCHRSAPLSAGRMVEAGLECGYHGIVYGGDGACVSIPGQVHIPPKARVRNYPLVEKDAMLWIWMGDPAAADPAAIPPSLALDDPGYRLQSGQLDYAAHYLLIDDNLLDLSHLSFAHEKTLGLDMPQWADERPRAVALERGMRFQRWLRNHPPRGFMKKLGERVDVWNSYDFLFPGIFLQRTGFYPLGTAERYGGKEPNEAPLFHRIDEQAVTPVSARASRYFFAAGARAGDIDPDRLDRLFAVTKIAFEEDKTIIEAQQRTIDLEPERQMLPTSLDAGPTQFRRLVETLMEA